MDPTRLPFEFDSSRFWIQPCMEVVVDDPESEFYGAVGRATTVDWGNGFDPYNNPEDRNDFPWFVDLAPGVKRTFRSSVLKKMPRD